MTEKPFKLCLIIIFCLLTQFTEIYSQPKTKNPFVKWATWAVLQALPSPTFFDDKNETGSSVKFGLEWQVIPLNYSFNANKYVSRMNFLFIHPVNRFSGSAELFFEPAVVLGDYKYASLKKFTFKTGARLVLPAAHYGEYLAFSLGAGYYRQTTVDDVNHDGLTYEAGIYSFFGMLGLKFNYNQNAVSRYNIGLYIKYY